MPYLEELKAQVKKEAGVFIAPGATVIGRVHLKKNASVWFSAVLRGDSDQIEIGERSNIQDGAVVHVDPNDPVVLGHDVIVGHRAIIHGAKVGNHTLIGMGATVLNNAEIGDYCIIGANALVTAGIKIPNRSLVLGSPAKIVGRVSDEQMKKIEKNADVYVQLAQKYNS